jgi:hypothetical protein
LSIKRKTETTLACRNHKSLNKNTNQQFMNISHPMGQKLLMLRSEVCESRFQTSRNMKWISEHFASQDNKDARLKVNLMILGHMILHPIQFL